MGCQKSTPEPTIKDTTKVKIRHLTQANANTFVEIKLNKLNDDYFVLNKIGEGSFGEVRIARHKQTKEERAVKFIKKSLLTSSQMTDLLNEYQILSRLDHPNIVQIYEFYDEEMHYCLVQDYVKGDDLFDIVSKVKKFTENKVKKITKTLLKAINYCHQSRIIHRDLKPENILLETDQDHKKLKIIDFGCGVVKTKKFWTLEDKKVSGFVGTAEYMAPEVIDGDYSEQCDVWSIGVITYLLLSGCHPFRRTNQDQKAFFEAVKRDKVIFPVRQWVQISDDAKNFVSKLLEKDPSKRLSASQALGHKWIKSNHDLIENQGEVMINLSNFRATQQLKQATYAYLGSRLVSKVDKQRLGNLFNHLDTNHDGRLSKSELRSGFQHHLHKILTDEETDQIFDQIDIDGSGSISFSEFVVAALGREELVCEDKLKQAFEVFDKDKTGVITSAQLRDVLGFSDTEEINNQISRMIDEVDENGDGQIQFGEFQTMMKQGMPSGTDISLSLKKLK